MYMHRCVNNVLSPTGVSIHIHVTLLQRDKELLVKMTSDTACTHTDKLYSI